MEKRKCKICNDVIEASRANAKFCSKDHYKPCKNCGKDYFVEKVVSPPEFCSVKCASSFREKNKKTFKKSCKLCGEAFYSSNANSRYCPKDHYRECKNCKRSFLIKNPSKAKDYCSHRCSKTYKGIEKECVRCGKGFLGSSNQIYCENLHYTNCENCGNVIEDKIAKHVTRFCSLSCASSGREARFEKKCEFCGKDFLSKVTWARFCNDVHTINCEICGKNMTVNPRNPASTCSKKCAAQLIDYDDRNSKSIKVWKEKYGEDITNPLQVKSIREKIKQQNLDKYGVENVSQAPEIQEKRKKTFLNNYGFESALTSPEVREKIKETNLERYGVENVYQSKEIKEKIKKTLQERYGIGIINPMQIKSVQNKAKETLLEKYGVESYLSFPGVQLKSSATQKKRISKLNRSWKKKLEEKLNTSVNLEALFADKMYADLEINGLFIDINPIVTHNNTISFVHALSFCKNEECNDPRHNPTPSSSHHDRFLAAEKEGKELLQYFDWYDEDKFISIVRAKLHLNEIRIGARKTKIREITQAEANKFFNENHLLGSTKGQSVCLGLFFEGELVHCQTYGQSRFNKNFEWEAIRSASKMNWSIVGGFSKCDKYFFEKFDPESIVSYVDLSISRGNTELMFPGWSVKSTNQASGHWINISNRGDKPFHITDRAARTISADRILGLEIGEKYPLLKENGDKVTNDEVLINEGYLKIFDAGTRTFEWRKVA